MPTLYNRGEKAQCRPCNVLTCSKGPGVVICILVCMWGFSEGRVESSVAKAKETNANLLGEAGYRW